MKITLITFKDKINIEWDFGAKYVLDFSTKSLLKLRDEILSSDSQFLLFWYDSSKLPTKDILTKVINSPGDLWHIGSKLGLTNQPKLLDSVQPTNILHAEIDHSFDHSSWKNTFRGNLMYKRVFEEIPLTTYSDDLDIVGLDFGYSAMKSGVITRYSSLLALHIDDLKIKKIGYNKQLQFIHKNFDLKAFIWSYFISILKISPFSFLKVFKSKEKLKNIVFEHPVKKNILDDKDTTVSIVIVTLERYSFLEKELEELKHLETQVQEIIIVDQTPKEIRNKKFLENFNDLPIIYIETNTIGQCSARNKGIEVAKSKFIWFLDDDMKDIPIHYLNNHLETIYNLNADISCGIPDEIGTNYIDRSIPKIELSDGFPTNDVLVKRELLLNIAGFDEKMNQKQSEDQEIGVRLIKNGALSIKNNQLRIVHLRASRGGLRKHNVRKITFASSRNSLFQRRFFHHSEIYLNLKHFTRKQVFKSLLLNLRGTFIINGFIIHKFLKVMIGLFLLPHTLYVIIKNLRLAKNMLND
jgi:GT2 family glycosyltransferase